MLAGQTKTEKKILVIYLILYTQCMTSRIDKN